MKENLIITFLSFLLKCWLSRDDAPNAMKKTVPAYRQKVPSEVRRTQKHGISMHWHLFPLTDKGPKRQRAYTPSRPHAEALAGPTTRKPRRLPQNFAVPFSTSAEDTAP